MEGKATLFIDKKLTIIKWNTDLNFMKDVGIKEEKKNILKLFQEYTLTKKMQYLAHLKIIKSFISKTLS